MLPDFPKSRREFEERFRLQLHQLVQRKAPLASLGKEVTAHEGERISYKQQTTLGSRTVQEPFKAIGTPITFQFSEIPELVGDRLAATMDRVADEMARQISVSGYEMLDKIMKEAGTAVEGKGSPPTKELYLTALQKIEIGFDRETNRPDMVFVAGPQMVQTMQSNWEEWKQDRDFMKQYKQLMSQKYEEWRDRESRRKLVD